MPDSLTALVIFAALLVPGFAFLIRTESRVAGQSYSALRETAIVVSASLAAHAAVLIVFGVFHSVLPSATPDVGALVRAPGRYAEAHYVELLVWGGALLAAATTVAAVLAVPPKRFVDRLEGSGRAQAFAASARRRTRSPIIADSGWTAAINASPKGRVVHAGIRLSDGAWVYGPVKRASTQLDENDDRSITILSPVEMRTATSSEAIKIDADSMLIPASQIKTITFHYQPKPPQ